MTKKSSSAIRPLLIEDNNLSTGWAKILLHIVNNTGHEISPLILSVTGFNEQGVPNESGSIRDELDKLLIHKGFRNVEDVAFTIFPQRLWQVAQGNRSQLFKFYRDAFPRYQAMNRSANRRGLYFERLMSYGRGPCDGNQLEWIISQFNKKKQAMRRSMFQASIFDPGRDHVADAQLQFPCLQHVTFEPTSEGLVVNAFYATQQLFAKAYGNYLGLARLGAFMANEMHLPLIRLNISIGVAKLDDIPKTHRELTSLLSVARTCMANEDIVMVTPPVNTKPASILK
jgi:hypothetical protein